MPIDMKILMFFLGKCVRTAQNHGCGQKKPKGISSSIFGVGIPGKCCARTQTLCRSNQTTKKTTEYSFDLFLSIKEIVFDFCRVTMRCRAKNAGYSTDLSKVYATSYWWPCCADGRADVSREGRTDGRTVKWLLRHYQNFLAWYVTKLA